MQSDRTSLTTLMNPDATTQINFASTSYFLSRSLIDPTESYVVTFDRNNELGAGSVSTVYRGIYQSHDVAVKVFNSKHTLLQELEAVRALHHPYLLTYFAYSITPPCLITELMPKNSLYHVLMEEELNWTTRINIALQVISALTYLHKNGLIHKDIKSLNILVDDDNNAKLADFDQAAKEKESLLCGTPPWMAPEILNVFRIVKQRYIMGTQVTKMTDIYSYGILLIELVAQSLFQDEYLCKLPVDPCQDNYVPEQQFYLDELMKLITLQPGLPIDYLRLIKDCLSDEPHLRPSAKKSKNRLKLLSNSADEMTASYSHMPHHLFAQSARQVVTLPLAEITYDDPTYSW